jgi:hypothetical protein
MDNQSASPVVLALLFVLRCLVPLLIMLGITYLLKRLGLIREPPSKPPGDDQPGAPSTFTTTPPPEKNEQQPGDQSTQDKLIENRLLSPLEGCLPYRHVPGDLLHGKA